MVKKPISIGRDNKGKISFPPPSGSKEYSFKARYNIAPTQNNLVIRKDLEAGSLTANEMRWGLVPSWSKSGSTTSLLINARSETIADKPSFKAAYQRRRCLVPADGYYEWKRQRHINQPYYFQLKDEELFCMAGVWETSHDPAGNSFDSFAILTTQANALASKLHDRMPVILQEEGAHEWLDGNPETIETESRFNLFAAISSDRMQCRPVNPIVNNNQNDSPECIERPRAEASTQLDMGF